MCTLDLNIFGIKHVKISIDHLSNRTKFALSETNFEFFQRKIFHEIFRSKVSISCDSIDKPLIQISQ